MQSYKSSSSSPTARTCVLASSSWEVVQYNRKQLPFEDDHCERVESIHHGGATMSPKIVFVRSRRTGRARLNHHQPQGG